MCAAHASHQGREQTRLNVLRKRIEGSFKLEEHEEPRSQLIDGGEHGQPEIVRDNVYVIEGGGEAGRRESRDLGMTVCRQVKRTSRKGTNKVLLSLMAGTGCPTHKHWIYKLHL